MSNLTEKCLLSLFVLLEVMEGKEEREEEQMADDQHSIIGGEDDDRERCADDDLSTWKRKN